ncbi:hypothetical protein RRG08_008954 [Elysia crispata]|uniref:Uncharacterized protein n=1 Tax=Elysia crispata TaxID=231223 RepID=A0AAE1DZE0_9GAST|nr:hypothetical protein RRG08_008954 [Elysia crispata]
MSRRADQSMTTDLPTTEIGRAPSLHMSGAVCSCRKKEGYNPKGATKQANKGHHRQRVNGRHIHRRCEIDVKDLTAGREPITTTGRAGKGAGAKRLWKN